MKPLVYLSLFCVHAVSLSAQVATPQKRMETLNLARQLLTTEPIHVSKDEVLYNNPFDPRKRVVAEVVTESAPAPEVSMSDRQVLTSTAESILPSGTMALGDKQILLFGQKKLKVGDTIPIVFQGKTYELELTGIERTSFTLRLNKEEITRPIKPVNKP